MKYSEFKKMLAAIKKEVAWYCSDGHVTLDEAWSLAIALGFRYWNMFGKPYWNQGEFQHAVENTVQNEILRLGISQKFPSTTSEIWKFSKTLDNPTLA